MTSISYEKELFEFSPKFQRLCEYLTSLSVIDAFYDLLTTSVQFSQLTELTFILYNHKKDNYFEYNDYYLDYEQFPKLKHLTLKVPSFCVKLNLPSLETLVLEAEINVFDSKTANTVLKLNNLKLLETTCLQLSPYLKAPKLETLILRNNTFLSMIFSTTSSIRGFPIEKLKKLVIIKNNISFDEIIKYTNLEHLELDIGRLGSDFEKVLEMEHLKFVKIIASTYENPENHIKIEEELKSRNVIVEIVEKPLSKSLRF